MNPFFFQPIKLEAAVSRARQRHHKHRDPTAADTASWLQGFLQTLRQTPADAYPHLFLPLRASQLRILIQHLPSLYPDALFGKLLHGLQTRRQSVVAAGLWGLMGRFCDLPELIAALTVLQTEPSRSRLVPEALPPLPRPLIDADTTAWMIARQYINGHQPWLDFVVNLKPLSPGTPPDRWDDLPLGRRILRIALLDSRAVYIREAHTSLVRWATAVLRRADLQDFALGYLSTVTYPNWHEQVLRFLIEKLGDPRLSPDNWTSIPQETVDLVIRWINTEKLSAFFLKGAQDSERFEFWREFVDYMGPHSIGYNAQGQGLFEFPSFGVVEFKDVGNAAYIYPLSAYQRFFQKAPTSSNDILKNRSEILYWRGKEMRILHHANWQYKWRRTIWTLIES